MSALKFSFDLSQLRFEVDGQSHEIDQGLSWIHSHSQGLGYLDGYAFEMMINEIEELLEQLNINHRIARVAQTSDLIMQQLSALFFQGSVLIDRIQLEHAFNQLIEHTEYYVQQVAAEHLHLFVYFVLVREMMHHLNVISIQINSHHNV